MIVSYKYIKGGEGLFKLKDTVGTKTNGYKLPWINTDWRSEESSYPLEQSGSGAAF